MEYKDVQSLNLTPGEQNSLTKLSLSKIVSNLKQQLEEEKKKNHNVRFAISPTSQIAGSQTGAGDQG